MRRGLVVLGVAGVLGAPARALAHDYWLVPDPMLSPRPTDVTLSLFVGDNLVVLEERAMQVERTARFLRVFRGGAADLLPEARAGARPLASIPGLPPGGHLFVLDRTPAHIELGAAKFEAYLREEGLDAIVAERARLGESEKVGRERYERFLKALVRIGDAGDAVFASQLDQTLEILPTRDPTVLDAGPLRVTVRFRKAPLAGARVELFSRPTDPAENDSYTADAVEREAATTGADGTVTFEPPARGAHVLRLVHMVRCEGCADADWQSFWASFTFATAPAELRDVVLPPPVAAPAGGKDDETGREPAERWPVVSGLVLSVLAAFAWLFYARGGRERA